MRNLMTSPTPTPKNSAKEEEKPAVGEQAVPSYESELAATADRIRETAKWLVATFGALAGALVAGLQISDVGELEGADKVIAGAGVLLALVAAVLIVALASVVLARGRVPLGDLAKGRRKLLIAELEQNDGLYAPYGSVEEFATAVSEQWRKQSESWLRMQTETDATAKEKAKEEFLETKKVLPGLNKLNKRLLAVARAEDVRVTFDTLRYAIVGLALVVVAGAGAFVFVNSVPDKTDDAEAAVVQTPVPALADLTSAGEEALGDSLGDECTFSRIPVMAISSSDEGWEVVSLPSSGCESARVTIGTDEGEVTAAESVDLDLPLELDPPEQ
jgi:hypothetical protein